jgi:hypothetical protein
LNIAERGQLERAKATELCLIQSKSDIQEPPYPALAPISICAYNVESSDGTGRKDETLSALLVQSLGRMRSRSSTETSLKESSLPTPPQKL